MRSVALITLALALGSSTAVYAQEAKTATPAPQLNDTQVLGRRVFQQRCAVCHTESTPGARRYGPPLYKELINGNEDVIGEFIRNGSAGKMPGFKYGLESNEIDAIVEYLKTVPRPAKRTGPVSEGPVD